MFIKKKVETFIAKNIHTKYFKITFCLISTLIVLNGFLPSFCFTKYSKIVNMFSQCPLCSNILYVIIQDCRIVTLQHLKVKTFGEKK